MANGAIGYGDLERRDFGGGVMPVLPSALRRISWGSVFAGLIVATMVSLVLALLGMAIGLGTVNPALEANPFAGLGVGAAIWWVVSSLIALFLGGWVAARVAGVPRGFDGAVHGVLVWGLTTLLTFFLLGTAVGHIIGGAGSLVGQGLGAAGKGASAVAPKAADKAQDLLRQQGITPQTIRNQAEQILGKTGNADPQAAASQQTTQQASQEAAQKADQLKAQAEVKAREWGQSAASGMSKASLWTFIGLLLGGFAAALGGRLGIPRETLAIAPSERR